MGTSIFTPRGKLAGATSQHLWEEGPVTSFLNLLRKESQKVGMRPGPADFSLWEPPAIYIPVAPGEGALLPAQHDSLCSGSWTGNAGVTGAQASKRNAKPDQKQRHLCLQTPLEVSRLETLGPPHQLWSNLRGGGLCLPSSRCTESKGHFLKPDGVNAHYSMSSFVT